MITVLGALMGIDLEATTRPEGSNEMPPGFGSSSQPGPSSPPKSSPSEPAKPAEDVKMTEPEPEEEDEDAKERKRAKTEADAEKARGAAAYKNRDFATAEEAFNKAWEISPTDITYLTNLAGERHKLASLTLHSLTITLYIATYFEKGDYDKCIETCEKAVEEGRSVSLITRS
jgi:stress-induced-phosphoprotein 1